MHKRNTTANINVFHLFLDNLGIFVSYCIASFIYLSIMNKNLFQEYLWIYVMFAVLFTSSMLIMRMYNITTFHYTDRIIKRVATSAVIAGMIMSMMMFLADMESISRLFFLSFCCASCMTVVSVRVVVRVCKRTAGATDTATSCLWATTAPSSGT